VVSNEKNERALGLLDCARSPYRIEATASPIVGFQIRIALVFATQLKCHRFVSLHRSSLYNNIETVRLQRTQIEAVADLLQLQWRTTTVPNCDMRAHPVSTHDMALFPRLASACPYLMTRLGARRQ
jgi:hypothetical protein